MASPSGVPAVTTAEGKQRAFLGHPIGLYVLFFTEMWERFSYYGMRGLLTLYMVNYFKWTQKYSSLHYKWYTGLVYLTPLLGGYLADRYLGNRRAVIIGAILMAIGHFLMAFEELEAFYAALIFLILGNGFFKPNMSTQVGRLYGPNDPRRDGAYTIFYMGINLGAFLAPLVCGWLAENTIGEYHSGFTMAGFGMVFGLLIYLFGQPWVQEIAQTTEETQKPVAERAADPSRETIELGLAPPSETAVERTASALPVLNQLAPLLLTLTGCAIALAAPVLAYLKYLAWNDASALEISAACFLIAAWITAKTKRAERDRVLAIYTLGVFVVFFWAAFEQAGNVLNIWADKITNRAFLGESQPPAVYPTVAEDGNADVEAEHGVWNRIRTMFVLKPRQQSGTEGQPAADNGNFIIPTTWFQSVNALAIFILAPIFAVMWTTLGRRGMNPSIPTKMALGVLLMALSLAIMVGAAKQEEKETDLPFQGKLPNGLGIDERHQLCPWKKDDQRNYVKDDKGQYVLDEPYHSGRLTYDPDTRTLRLLGVFPDIERDRVVRDTAPADFAVKVDELRKLADETTEKKINVSVQLEKVPDGFDWKYAGFKQSEVKYDPAAKTLTARKRLADKDAKAMLVAAGDPALRDTLNKLMKESSKYRVSYGWLFWSYIIATLGELCLSPVGLSMVSKLAPARFATMLMGMWLLTSFFGNFVAGAMGELWETKTPTNFFIFFVVALSVASLILFLLVRKVVAMMHGVN